MSSSLSSRHHHSSSQNGGYHNQYHHNNNDKEDALGGGHRGGAGGVGGMAIVFDFSANVTLFDWTSRNGIEYAVLLFFAFGVAYATEYVAHARRHDGGANGGGAGTFGAASTLTQGGGGGGGAYESANGPERKMMMMGTTMHHHHHQRVLHGAKYATHQLMSYVLMLCVMSLNFGILVSVILGLGVGNYTFNAHGGRRRASMVSDAGCNPE
tara:strand:+ start:345 stop:977 length:633 start_codon:yes stop_codon:yes gene_type:complete